MTIEKIKEVLEAKGMKKKKLAERLSMTPQYLSNILNGRVVPGNLKETLDRIEMILLPK